MRIAVGQASATADVDNAVASAVDLVRSALEHDARLLVLSELFLTGYDPALWTRDHSLTPDDPRLQPLRAASLATGIAVLAGGATIGPDGSLRNSMLLFDRAGAVSIPYDKRHLWIGERNTFAEGDTAVALQIDDVLIGLGICYDAGFPETTRAYAQARVDAIIFSSAFAVGDEARRYEIYHPARALESGCYLAVANASGNLGDVLFSGNSLTIDPRGNVIDRLGEDAEGQVIVIDVDPRIVHEARAALPYLDDLRPITEVHTITTETF